jgi:hypothetical protein
LKHPEAGTLTRSVFKELSKTDDIKMYQLKDEATKHMTRLTTKELPFYRFYQLKEDSETD